ncbi:MAG TPA: OmpH family outer membrane protein [Vicinamibacterales bacterium]|nr:OmpH family outer membrane protein [Vicinamibacterales bacterium]
MSRVCRHVAAVGIFATASSSPAFAQAVDALRVGLVSMSYVTRNSRSGKTAIAQLEQLVKEKEAAAAVRIAELQKQELEAQRTNSALLHKALERSRVEYQRFQQDAQSEIEAMQAKFDGEFRIKVAPIVEETSKEKGLHFVFGLEQAAIVWWSPAADISEDVVKRLDARK